MGCRNVSLGLISRPFVLGLFWRTHNVADIGRGPVLQQQQHDVEVTHEGCHVDGSQTGLHRGGQSQGTMRETRYQTTQRRVGNNQRYKALDYSIVTLYNSGYRGIGPAWGLTSVMAWMEAPYFTSSSMTFTRFFLQAMCSGVKPFYSRRREWIYQ